MQNIKSGFPILGTTVNKKPLVYLDSAATTQKPQVVIDSIANTYESANSNIHRGIHYLSNVATRAHEAARDKVAKFINAREPKEILFTRGTTESINLVAQCFTEKYCDKGDEIIVTMMEHHSNIVPWQMACERHDLTLKVAPINEKGELIVEELYKLFTKKTKILSLAHVSNVMGTINPIKDIIAEAHRNGIKVLVDGAQAIAHMSVDVQDLGADFYAFSGHKLYAPNGIGVLYGRHEILDSMPPYHGGGEMIETVSFKGTTYNVLPYKYEAGTPDYVGSVALGVAIDYLSEIGMGNIVAHEKEIMQYATQKMKKIKDMRIIGEAEQKSGAISFLVGKHHPVDIGMLLDKQGIAIRTGHHCAQPLIEWFNISGTARVSFGVYTTKGDIDKFINALNVAIEILG